MGRIVLLCGELRGMGRTESGEVIARTQMVPSRQGDSTASTEPEYLDFAVVDAPADLPDGNYTLQVANHLLTTTRKKGLWLTCNESKQQSPSSADSEELIEADR